MQLIQMGNNENFITHEIVILVSDDRLQLESW
jgi:hypothetical protein